MPDGAANAGTAAAAASSTWTNENELRPAPAMGKLAGAHELGVRAIRRGRRCRDRRDSRNAVRLLRRRPSPAPRSRAPGPPARYADTVAAHSDTTDQSRT